MPIDISRCMKLPTLPTIAIEVLRLFDDPNSSIEDIAGVIRKDPAIATRLLKAANSSQFGTRGKITDVRRAATMLGRKSVAPLVLSFSLANQTTEPTHHADYFRQFWLRSFVQATASELLGGYFRSSELTAECYTVSLLSGVGKLAFLKAEPDQYISLLNRSETEGVSLTTLEQEEFGLTHHKMSATMLSQVGLPPRCAVAIMSLDRLPTEFRAGDETEMLLIRITRAANSIASLLCDRRPAQSMIELEESLEDLRLPAEVTSEALLQLVQQRIDATADLFDIDPKKIPPVSEILQDALEQLSRISMLASEPDNSNQLPDELLEENGRLKRRVADLLKASRVDSLTGVCNRAYVTSQMIERAALHRVRGQALGMAVIDIDHFKKFNDTHGHQAGDQVLRQVATSLQSGIRDVDLLGRYGGEEFVVILEDITTEDLPIVGERLRKAVAAMVLRLNDQEIPVTVSIGLTCSLVEGDEQSFCERLFATADLAMYRAKQTGRNRFCIEVPGHSDSTLPETSLVGNHL